MTLLVLVLVTHTESRLLINYNYLRFHTNNYVLGKEIDEKVNLLFTRVWDKQRLRSRLMSG